MPENDKPVLVYATYPDVATAEAAGRALVEARLVACVNILPGMISIYRWQGAIEQGSETVLIMKTRAALAEPAIGWARAHHPYETPAFVVLPVVGGSPPYLDWIVAATGPEPPATAE